MPKHSKNGASLAALALACISPAFASSVGTTSVFTPGNLILSRSVYSAPASAVTVGQQLPPVCGTQASCTGKATNDGSYPNVFLNANVDGSFGITSPIYLDQISTGGSLLNTFSIPTSVLVTSFSSKSELALNLSSDGSAITFMGYVAPVNTLDVSNSNTPGVVDPTNPVGSAYYRAVARVDAYGNISVTETNAYSGNNGRAAAEADNFYYTVGNSNNGSGTPANVVGAAGAQLVTPGTMPETPVPLGSFSITQYGYPADKKGKDNNFRGLTVFDNTVYIAKGSGSNGINTVYFVDTTGKACPNGVGLPVSGAALPSAPLPYDASTLATTGLPTNMCVLAGFPSTPNKSAATLAYPFGIWFADADTVYVADEGDGYTGGSDLYTHAAAQTSAGLQKWVFDATAQSWKLAYTLQAGLGLGQPYSVRDYPVGVNPATSLPWSPATDGLRNFTGRADRDGKVTIWAVTSTVSGNGDIGADPNRLVAIRDDLKNTSASAAAKESFVTLRAAKFAEVLRGVSFTPDENDDHGSRH